MIEATVSRGAFTAIVGATLHVLLAAVENAHRSERAAPPQHKDMRVAETLQPLADIRQPISQLPATPNDLRQEREAPVDRRSDPAIPR